MMEVLAMIRKILKISASVFALATMSNVAHSATSSATASANVIQPIAITTDVNMSFGDLYPSAVAGTVALATTGTRTNGGGVTLGPTTGTAAQFTVTGTDGATYTITLPTTDQNITSGANTMVVNGFGHDAGGTPTLTGGTQTFNVGATLNVGIDQAPGSYSGSFDVTVNYN